MPVYEVSAKIKFLQTKQMLFTVKYLARIEAKTMHFRYDICFWQVLVTPSNKARSKIRRRAQFAHFALNFYKPNLTFHKLTCIENVDINVDYLVIIVASAITTEAKNEAISNAHSGMIYSPRASFNFLSPSYGHNWIILMLNESSTNV